MNVVVFGATSAIAAAVAKRFAAAGDSLYLFGRDAAKLERVTADVAAAGPRHRVCSAPMDALRYDAHQRWIDEAVAALGSIDVALVAWGTLPDQRAVEHDVDALLRELDVNARSVIALCARLGAYFESRGGGTLAVIGSVAGDRGRQSNYVYGAAKAAVAVFLQGLRNRLHGAGVHVLTIKPGFVDTPMTAHLPKGALWTSPERAAAAIHRAILGHRDVVYVPGWWRAVLAVVRAIPERVFKRLEL